MTASLAAARNQGVLGPHGWHLLMAAAWVVVFAGTVLVQHLRRGSPRSARAGGDLGDRRRRPVRAEPWLQAAAVAAASAATVHLAVMPDHFDESVLYGLFFLGAAVSQLGFAAAILVRPRRPLLLAGAAGSAALIALWLVTRLAGIPVGPGQGETEPFGVIDAVATAAEAVTIACLLMAMRAVEAGAPWRWSRWSPGLRLAAPACLAATVVVSALAPRT